MRRHEAAREGARAPVPLMPVDRAPEEGARARVYGAARPAAARRALTSDVAKSYQAVGKETSRAKQQAAAEKIGGGARWKPLPAIEGVRPSTAGRREAGCGGHARASTLQAAPGARRAA